MSEETKMVCPSCGQEIEVTKIRTREKVAYKYMSFTKAVGVCPNCLSDIHLPEVDTMVAYFQTLNKDYMLELNKYTNVSDVSRDSDFAKDWETIPEDDLTFETIGSQIVSYHIQYYGTLLKNDLGYDVVSLDDDLYLEKYEEIITEIIGDETDTTDEEDIRYKYFKTYAYVNGSVKEVCAMWWKDIEGNVSGIICNTDDVNAYRYGKQKTKDKYVIS